MHDDAHKLTGLYTALSIVAIFLFLALLSLSTGGGDVGWRQIFDFLSLEEIDGTSRLIITQIRLPRLCAAILAGASLALAGAGMQSLFRNPLADPSVTGVSSGAALGAVVAVAFFSTLWTMQLFALLGGLAAVAVVCAIGRVNGKDSVLSTLLAGIAVNAFCAAIVGFFMYSVRDAGLRGFVFWMLGSLDRCTWAQIITACIICIPSGIAIFALSSSLNLMLLGRDQAFHSGVNANKVWLIVTIAAAAMTAAVVAICGIIGFVGLVVPHILRLLIGPDNKKLLPLSAAGGASLLIFSDVVARTFSQTDPVPIGVITSFIGAPFFAFLLRSKGIRND